MLGSASRGEILLVVGLIFLAGCSGAVPGDPTASDTEPETSPTVEPQPVNGKLEVDVTTRLCTFK